MEEGDKTWRDTLKLLLFVRVSQSQNRARQSEMKGSAPRRHLLHRRGFGLRLVAPLAWSSAWKRGSHARPSQTTVLRLLLAVAARVGTSVQAALLFEAAGCSRFRAALGWLARLAVRPKMHKQSRYRLRVYLKQELLGKEALDSRLVGIATEPVCDRHYDDSSLSGNHHIYTRLLSFKFD